MEGEAAAERPATRVQTMKLSVPPEVVRAVSTSVALEGLGMHWSSSPIDGEAGAETLFQKSKVVTKIDDFISHDWGTPRWQKIIALCYWYNLTAAISFSYLAAALVGVADLIWPGKLRTAQLSQAQPGVVVDGYNWWTFPGGASVFLVIFFYWQQIRFVLFRVTRDLFVDKLCIHQTDEELKEAGVYGLGGLIKCSTDLVVIWSPRYFSRLWCAFEVASWVHSGKESESVHVLPARAVTVTMINMVVLLIFRIVALAVPAVIWPGFLLLVVVFPAVSMYWAERDLTTLKDQVAQFHIEVADCYCCHVGHKDPRTGQMMRCDREIVLNAVTTWFVSKDAAADASIPNFNSLVQSQWGPTIIRSLQNRSALYRQGMTIAVPLVWEQLSKLAIVKVSSPLEIVVFLGSSLVYVFLICPLVYGLSYLIASQVYKSQLPFCQAQIPEQCILPAKQITVVVGICIMATCVSSPFPLVLVSFAPGWPIALVTAILLAMTLILYCGPDRRGGTWCCKRSVAKPEDVVSGPGIGMVVDV